MSTGVVVEMKGGRWKRYPAYRDSGVEWIGEVPEGWAAIGLRRLLDSVNGIKIGPFGSQLKSDIIQPAGFKVYGQENVIAKNFDLGNRFVDEDKFKELAVCEIISGDIVVTMMGTTGRCQVVPENIQKGIMDSHLLRIRINEMTINPIFLEIIIDEALYIKHQIKVAGKGSIMHGLNSSIIKSLSIALPPLPEQRAIAAFLDRETGRIDTLIEKKVRQIELLQEKRAALISHAVTNGLDPDVMMKDSGVEWLGEVPDVWGIVRVKLLEGNDTSVVQTGPFGAQLHASDYLDEGVPFILIRNVRNLKIDETDIPRISEEDAERLFMYRLNVGDIVFSRVGSIGRIALCTEREKGWLISGQMLRLRIQNPMLDSKFSLYAFSSKCLLTFVELQSVGSTRESINTDILRNMPIPIPPLPEQRAIAAFLDRETGRIDTLTTKVSESLSKLREYRTALISAAVTGKIDVRNKET